MSWHCHRGARSHIDTSVIANPHENKTIIFRIADKSFSLFVPARGSLAVNIVVMGAVCLIHEKCLTLHLKAAILS